MGNFEKAQKVLKLAHTMDQESFQISTNQICSNHSGTDQSECNLENSSQRNAKTLEQKGKLLYDSGHPQQALRDYTKCASLEPWNMDCQLHKALSNLNMGKFFQGVKDLTVKGS